jgi:hypothetical protein
VCECVSCGGISLLARSLTRGRSGHRERAYGRLVRRTVGGPDQRARGAHSRGDDDQPVLRAADCVEGAPFLRSVRVSVPRCFSSPFKTAGTYQLERPNPFVSGEEAAKVCDSEACCVFFFFL